MPHETDRPVFGAADPGPDAAPGCTPPEEDPAALDAKPVIYLYPEAETEVTVSLDYDGELTCVYPAFDGGASWSVTAAPDGTLTDAAGQTYNYLYWEGVSDADYDFSEGFCVPGGDTAAFLEDALAAPGPHPPGGQRVHRLLAAPDGGERL